MIDSHHLLRAFSIRGTALNDLWHVIFSQQSFEKDTVYSHFIDEEKEPQ